MNAENTGTEFTSSKAGRNPEVFMAFRNVEYIAAGVTFGSRNNGYGFGTYQAGDGAIGLPGGGGKVMVQQDIDYSKWHVSDIYYGETDGFAIIDDEDLGMSFGISGKYIAQSLTNVMFGFYPWTGHYAHQYVGEVLIFNEKLSESDRSVVTSYLMSKWGISSSTSCAESSVDKPTSVVSQLQSLTPPTCMRPGGTGLFFNGTSWICECLQNSTHVYHGASCEDLCPIYTHYFNATTLSCQELYTSSSLVTINGKNLYQDSEGWILLLAYRHIPGDETALLSGTAPLSPTDGYSHIWLKDLGLSASDVDSVRFYCKTTSHPRVWHISSSNSWVKNALVEGKYDDNKASYWSDVVKFPDHNAYITSEGYPYDFFYLNLLQGPFARGGRYYWEISGLPYAINCDDVGYQRYQKDSLHQIWFKRKS